MSKKIVVQDKEVSPKKMKFKSNKATASTGRNYQTKPKEVPPTKIKIHHEFDTGLHFNHKINITIRNINAVIRLIFKNTKE